MCHVPSYFVATSSVMVPNLQLHYGQLTSHGKLVSPVPLVERPQAQYWWQPDLIFIVASPTCLQVQHMDDFVPSTRYPWADYKQQLTLACIRASPKRSQNQHIQWPVSVMTEYNLIRQAPQCIVANP